MPNTPTSTATTSAARQRARAARLSRSRVDGYVRAPTRVRVGHHAYPGWWEWWWSVGWGVPAHRQGPVEGGEPGAREHLPVPLGKLGGVQEPVAGLVVKPPGVGVEPEQLPRLPDGPAVACQVTEQDAERLADEPATWDRGGGGDVVDQHHPRSHVAGSSARRSASCSV